MVAPFVGASIEVYQAISLIIATVLGGGIAKLYLANAQKEHTRAENVSLVVGTFERALVEARQQIETLTRLSLECETDRKLLHKEIRLLRVEVAELKDRLKDREVT